MRHVSSPLILFIVLWGYGMDSRQGHAADAPAATRQVNVLEVIAPKELQVRSAANLPRVDLSWTDNIEGETGFAIERSADGGKAFEEVARIRADSTGHIDHDVRRDTAYAYRVRAIGPDWMTEATPPEPTRTADFQVFDAMAFEQKPTLSRMGMDLLYIAYAPAFSARGGSSYAQPAERATRMAARRAPADGVMVIDIEHWPVDVRGASMEEVTANLAKLALIVGWIRDERPDVKLGFYGILPLRDYWTPVLLAQAQRLPEGSDRPVRLEKAQREHERWLAANDVVQKHLGDQVDLLFPSLYTFYDDTEGWRAYARANLEEARRVGKPVYPFLWMAYHESNVKLAGRMLPPDTWRAQLETCRQFADGIVIWGGWDMRANRPLRWPPKAGWWQVTEEFLRVHVWDSTRGGTRE